MADAQGVLLRGVLVIAAADHRGEVRLLRHALECGRGIVSLHPLPR